MDLAALTEKLSTALKGGVDFDNIVKFDFGDQGVVHLNGQTGEVSNEDGDADATISLSMDDFVAMAQGDLDPMQAFMMQKLKVSGDMSVAMKLQSILKNLA